MHIQTRDSGMIIGIPIVQITGSMKRLFLILTIISLHYSCVPTRIAPTIKDYKVMRGKKFKRSLPERQMFVFKDPKAANEFYHYINTKFELNHINVYDDVPFLLGTNQYFFSFYEVEIPTKTINLVPLAVDVLLQSADIDPIMDGAYETRKGNWYVAIEVYSDNEQDSLHENSTSLSNISKFLRLLKNEYLASHNYNEVLFKN